MPDNTTLLTRSGLDLDLAVFLAEAADKAYTPANVIKSWAAKNGFGANCTAFDHNNIQGFWCATADVALLAFRGTDNPGHWIRDMRIIPVDYDWGRVHAGFKGGIDNAEPALKAFAEVAKGVKHVWITGHSLGGALAVLAAAELKRAGVDASLYTYGQPRVGLSAFADRFEQEFPERLIRFVNQSDIVPRVPPPGLILSYRHMGIVKRITSSHGLEAVADIDDVPEEPMSEAEFEALQLQLQAPSEQSLEGAFDMFSDHSMTQYLALLTEIRG